MAAATPSSSNVKTCTQLEARGIIASGIVPVAVYTDPSAYGKCACQAMTATATILSHHKHKACLCNVSQRPSVLLRGCCSVPSLRSGQRPRRAEPVTAEEQENVSLLSERHAEMQLEGCFHSTSSFATMLTPAALAAAHAAAWYLSRDSGRRSSLAGSVGHAYRSLAGCHW